jgi:hypothetical protein
MAGQVKDQKWLVPIFEHINLFRFHKNDLRELPTMKLGSF